ncbi:DUF4097 family beta strand repeat-containing protein [Kitasatospora sp. NPDC093558]|uniref:DUF4097 family beta strand repeat-containing protein n=1 Tax=Kitasatospora sp. NPDC093558 TaxID=3155201 RepID=UPI0034498F4B
MQKFDTPAPISTALDIPAGRVHIIAADQADTAVEVLPADASKHRDVTAAEQTRVGCTDGLLWIEAALPKSRLVGNTGAVEVTVRLPAGSRVEAKVASGGFRAVGRLGDVTFEGAQGSVEIDEATGARLTLQAGDISVGRLGSSAVISTRKGDIRIAEAMSGTLELRTEAGDVSVCAASGVSASLDAGSSHGRIHNSLRNTEGIAGLTIHATTAYGDITARSL